jgi:hypothetical protein
LALRIEEFAVISDRRDNNERLAVLAMELSVVLHATLNDLAAAGQADRACRLAARACAVLRKNDPEQWGRFNRLLHRLSPMTDDIGNASSAADREKLHEAGPI